MTDVRLQMLRAAVANGAAFTAEESAWLLGQYDAVLAAGTELARESAKFRATVLASQEDAEVSTEWGVRWDEVGDDYELRRSEADARGLHASYRSGTTVVSREVRRGPWTAVES